MENTWKQVFIFMRRAMRLGHTGQTAGTDSWDRQIDWQTDREKTVLTSSNISPMFGQSNCSVSRPCGEQFFN